MKQSKYRKIRRCYVDMDGVLADFDQAFEDLTGMSPERFEHMFGHDKFWEKVYSTTSFFYFLPEFEHTKRLWKFLEKQFPHLIILSSPSRTNTAICVQDKRDWIDNHLGIRVPAIFEKDKFIYAGPDAILIDDTDRKLKKWTDAGGIAVKFKDANDTIRQIKVLLNERLQPIQGEST